MRYSFFKELGYQKMFLKAHTKWAKDLIFLSKIRNFENFKKQLSLNGEVRFLEKKP